MCLLGAVLDCVEPVSLFETRREYIHVGSALAPASDGLKKRDRLDAVFAACGSRFCKTAAKATVELGARRSPDLFSGPSPAGAGAETTGMYLRRVQKKDLDRLATKTR